MSKIERISLFFPKENVFYQRLYLYFKEAFEREGIQVSGKLTLLDDEHMLTWCSIHKPSVIFEMNRVKNEISILHELKILHISWIVDLQGRNESNIDGSEITYFFDPGWAENYKTSGFTDWLPPAAYLKEFNPTQRDISVVYKCDVSFIGHIPLPWSNEILAKKIYNNILFSDLLDEYEKQLPGFYSLTSTHLLLTQNIDRIVYELTGQHLSLSREIYYDLLERLNRVVQRNTLLSYALNHTKKINIYGSDNWRAWSQYKKYFKGYMGSPLEMSKLFKASSINLHDGVGFHFRSIECLASGGRLFHMKNKKVKQGLDSCFENNYHYFEFDSENHNDLFFYAKDTPYIGSSAQIDTFEIIKNGHTWEHRVDKILKDIKSII
jgi:hypothetical protein